MSNTNLTGYPSIDRPWLKYYTEEAINAKLTTDSIYEYLYKSNQDNLDGVAINYMDRKITYGELFRNIELSAKAFHGYGIGNGRFLRTPTRLSFLNTTSTWYRNSARTNAKFRSVRKSIPFRVWFTVLIVEARCISVVPVV